MALKRKINKAAYDALPDLVKAEYKAGATADEFILDTEPDEDTGALTRALAREKADREAAKKRAELAEARTAELEGKLTEEQRELLRKSKDLDTLEKSWKTEKDNAVAAEKKQTAKREDALKDLMMGRTAREIAERICTVPGVLLPHIQSRLKFEIVDDVPTVRVLDVKGDPTAKTVKDLEDEFRANKDFASIIIAGKSTGSGASGGSHGSGALTGKKFAELTGPERAAFLQADPAGFKRASEAAKESRPFKT